MLEQPTDDDRACEAPDDQSRAARSASHGTSDRCQRCLHSVARLGTLTTLFVTSSKQFRHEADGQVDSYPPFTAAVRVSKKGRARPMLTMT